MMSPSSTDRCARVAGVTRSDHAGACGRIPPQSRCAMPVSKVIPTRAENSQPWRNFSHGNEKM